MGRRRLGGPQQIGPIAAALADRIAKGNAPVPAVNDYSNVKKVGVIGAGVAGLQAANELRKAGFEVKIFEKSEGVAGVWRANYADFGLQVPRELYEFPGYPYPDAKKMELSGSKFAKFPKGPEVAEYTQMFADDMKLKELINFETFVTALDPAAGGDGWVMRYGKQGGKETSEEFDFVVVATGMYSWPPHIPKAKGMDKFKGSILHSCQFTDSSICEGKNGPVGGVLDRLLCCRAKGGAKTSSLAFRSAHWPVPRKLSIWCPSGTYCDLATSCSTRTTTARLWEVHPRRSRAGKVALVAHRRDHVPRPIWAQGRPAAQEPDRA